MKEEWKKELVIITGMSGAGKSEAMDFFEDRGYFCIDNFPINLFQYLNEIFISSEKRDKVAVAIDIRNQEFMSQFNKQLKLLNDLKIDYTIIYLDARTSVLLSRYELSRRKPFKSPRYFAGKYRRRKKTYQKFYAESRYCD